MATDIFTSSGSWLCPTAVTSVSVECWGAGGGGGANFASYGSTPGHGGGGGGGAYSKKNTYAVTPGNSYTVVVGVGGTGGSFNGSHTPTDATDGGDSYFDNTGVVLAKGGVHGGTVSGSLSGTGGAGGATASGVGDTKYRGGNGSTPDGSFRAGGGGGGAGSTGNGGDSPVAGTGGLGTSIGGGNGGDGALSVSTPGDNGNSLGGGGGGGVGAGPSTTNGYGGNGANGQVNISYTPNSDQVTTPADTSTVTESVKLNLPGSHSAPVITFRQAVSPYAVVASVSYAQTTPYGSTLPVLVENDSNPVSFRIYNNFALANRIADALNVSITTYDGVGVHTASMPVASQFWAHARQYGFGQNASTPGLYTVAIDTDHTMGGAGNKYSFPWGSDSLTPANIRAGDTGRGCGFIETQTYLQVPAGAVAKAHLFAFSVTYNWTT